MRKNEFFEQKGPFLLSELFNDVNLDQKQKIYDIKSLEDSKISDLTFLESSNYIKAAKCSYDRVRSLTFRRWWRRANAFEN